MPISPTLPSGFHSDADMLNSQPLRRAPVPAFVGVRSAEAYRAQSDWQTEPVEDEASRNRAANNRLLFCLIGGFGILILLGVTALDNFHLLPKRAPVEVASADKPLFV